MPKVDRRGSAERWLHERAQDGMFGSPAIGLAFYYAGLLMALQWVAFAPEVFGPLAAAVDAETRLIPGIPGGVEGRDRFLRHVTESAQLMMARRAAQGEEKAR